MHVQTFLPIELPGIHVWNSLPEDIVSASTLGAIRGRLSNLDLYMYCAGIFD